MKQLAQESPLPGILDEIYEATKFPKNNERRSHKYLFPRMAISIFLKRKGYNFHEIGYVFNKDHSTIMNAYYIGLNYIGVNTLDINTLSN